MWTTLRSPISADVVAEVVRDSADYVDMKEQRHFVAAGKRFFFAGSASPNRLPLLRRIHDDIARQVPFDELFEQPVIDHAYLLFKSAGAPATAIHQDRPYWLDKEPTPTMFTAWASLTTIGPDKGALTLNAANWVAPEQIRAFNTAGALYEHTEHVYSAGNTALAVDSTADLSLRPTLSPVPAGAGEVIVFDGFEPHGSTDNASESSRLALKVVYGEGRQVARYLMTLRELAAV